jgi:hypothetical protein
MHLPTHKGSEILSHCSTPYTDTQIFEAGHKPNVKSLSGISNGKDQFRIVAQFHARSSTLAQLKDATNRHTQRLLRDRSVEDSESSSSDADYAHDENDDLLTDEHTSRPCEMAAKLPLLEMSYELSLYTGSLFHLGQKAGGFSDWSWLHVILKLRPLYAGEIMQRRLQNTSSMLNSFHH